MNLQLQQISLIYDRRATVHIPESADVDRRARMLSALPLLDTATQLTE